MDGAKGRDHTLHTSRVHATTRKRKPLRDSEHWSDVFGWESKSYKVASPRVAGEHSSEDSVQPVMVSTGRSGFRKGNDDRSLKPAEGLEGIKVVPAAGR